MYLIPYARITLRSALPPRAFADRLSQLLLRPLYADREFKGEVVDCDFRLSRVRTFQLNKFLTEGRIAPATGGSSVSLVIRAHAYVAVGMAVLLLAALGFAIAAVVSLAKGTSYHYVSSLAWVVSVYVAAVVLPFFLEVRKVLRFLAPLGDRVKTAIP